MRLLVTNTRAAQAYFIIRALRPLADRIVVTMYGDTPWTARLSHAAASSLVDARYHVPSPASDWRKGRVEKENSAREEAYIRQVLEICQREQIDTLFPSWDAHIRVLAKNRARFEQLGVLIPLPDHDTLIAALDKYRAIRAAQDAGLACPRTYVPDSLNEVGRLADELGFPVVVKPRYTSWGMEIVRDRTSLSRKTQELADTYGMPLLQEYIPGGQREDVHLLLDRSGDVIMAFPRATRRSLRLDPHGHLSTVHQSTTCADHVPDAIGMLRRLGCWGSATVETIIDPRDGQRKFVELVPRFRRQLWNTTELGINVPWMCLKIARGEAVEPIKDYPVGVLFLNPVEDVLALGFQFLDLIAYKLKTKILGHAPLEPWNPPPSVPALWRSVAHAYLGPSPKLVDPYCRYFFRDPIASILWWLQLSSWMAGLARQLGR